MRSHGILNVAKARNPVRSDETIYSVKRDSFTDQLKRYERANSTESGRIYLASQPEFSKRIQCYVPIESECISTDIEFIEFSSNCALGKISLKYTTDTFLHIVDICGNSSDESLHYPRSFSGSDILISFDIEDHDFQIEIDWKCSDVENFGLNDCIVGEDFIVEDKFLKMKDQFQDFSIDCLLKSAAMDRTEECQTYEVIWDHDDSPWYLTQNTPFVRFS